MSISGFLLMPESQDIDCIIVRLVAIQGDIARIPERDHQFAQVCMSWKGPSRFRMRFQARKLLFDRLSGFA